MINQDIQRSAEPTVLSCHSSLVRQASSFSIGQLSSPIDQFRRGVMPRIVMIAAILFALFAMPVLAKEPSYVFNLRRDYQHELCAHMKTVFDTNFQHMWTDPVLTKPLDAIFSKDSEYAFPMLPGQSHDTRMTMQMRYSKVPSSQEFEAIPWHEGHAVFGGVGSGSANNVLPYLIAYADIDNDGLVDTIVKVGFTKGYSWMFSRGDAEAGIGEMVLAYRSTKIEQTDLTTIDELIRGSERFGKPLSLTSGYLRPLLYQGKTYAAIYDQGFGEKATKQSRANLEKDIPPHEQVLVTSYAYIRRKGDVDTIGRLRWTQTTLCAFDMIQNGMDG